MANLDTESAQTPGSPKWEGLSEIDQAIRDNRLMEYRIKKSWADPWVRGDNYDGRLSGNYDGR